MTLPRGAQLHLLVAMNTVAKVSSDESSGIAMKILEPTLARRESIDDENKSETRCESDAGVLKRRSYPSPVSTVGLLCRHTALDGLELPVELLS